MSSLYFTYIENDHCWVPLSLLLKFLSFFIHNDYTIHTCMIYYRVQYLFAYYGIFWMLDFNNMVMIIWRLTLIFGPLWNSITIKINLCFNTNFGLNYKYNINVLLNPACISVTSCTFIISGVWSKLLRHF